MEGDESVVAGSAADDDAAHQSFQGDDGMDEAYGDDFPAAYGGEGSDSS